MITFQQLEQTAAASGYQSSARGTVRVVHPGVASRAQRGGRRTRLRRSQPAEPRARRVTLDSVHPLHAALTKGEGESAMAAQVVVSALRRWLVDPVDGPPPVRGAVFRHSRGEIWIAHTTIEHAAVLRGKASALRDLGSALTVAVSQGFGEALRVRTEPVVFVGADEGRLVIRSDLGTVALSPLDAQRVEHWLAESIHPDDKRGAVCLPAAWQAD